MVLRGRLVKTGMHVHPEKVGDPQTALAVLKAQCPRLKRAGPGPHSIGKIRTQECWELHPKTRSPVSGMGKGQHTGRVSGGSGPEWTQGFSVLDSRLGTSNFEERHL